jgi:hypothetical protein
MEKQTTPARIVKTTNFDLWTRQKEKASNFKTMNVEGLLRDFYGDSL